MPSTTTSLSAPAAAAPRFRLRPIHGLLLALALLLVALYGAALPRLLPSWLPPWLLIPFAPLLIPATFFNPFFGSLIGLAIAVVAAVVVAALGYRHAAGRPRLRGFFAGGALLALLFPTFMPTLYGSYELHIEATPGHELHWLTQPATPWHSALKSAHRNMEIVGCPFSLDGWSADNVLYFRDGCTANYWRFDPSRDGAAQPSATRPAIASRVRLGPGALGWMGAGTPAPPPTIQATSGTFVGARERSTSPDGQWEAVVVANVYGPLDVVVVSR